MFLQIKLETTHGRESFIVTKVEMVGIYHGIQKVEEVLGHLLRDLAETTIASRIEEQKLHRLVVKSSILLHLLLCEELRASRAALKKTQSYE